MKPLIGRCILAVDSDAAGLSQWRERLLGQGGRVICSASVDSAIANAVTFPGGTFDAALIEHRPPVLDAREVAESVRALPGTRGLPLLVVATGDDVRALEVPMAAPSLVLSRPAAADDFVLHLERMFAVAHTPGSIAAAVPSVEKRAKILVAEDDPVNAEALRAMLAQLGHDVVMARNGEEAVARAASCTFDAILMDGQMPVMDGLEATRIIRDDEARRGLRRPIIGVTASTLDEYRDHCIDAGMDDVVQKPVGMAGLLRVLSRWVLPPTPVPRERVSTAVTARASIRSDPRPTDTAIDWRQIESLRSIDPQGKTGIVGRAIDLYIDNAPQLIDEIRSFRSGRDMADVRRAAHSLKSSSASLGATVVAGLSRTIEQAAAQGNYEIIDATVCSLESEYWRAARELRKAVA